MAVKVLRVSRVQSIADMRHVITVHHHHWLLFRLSSRCRQHHTQILTRWRLYRVTRHLSMMTQVNVITAQVISIWTMYICWNAVHIVDTYCGTYSNQFLDNYNFSNCQLGQTVSLLIHYYFKQQYRHNHKVSNNRQKYHLQYFIFLKTLCY